MSEKPPSEKLPTGWALATLQDFAAEEPHSLVDGPFGSNLKTSHYRDEGPRVIRLQNIGDGEFLNEEAHISMEHFETLRKHEARAADLVIAILGSPLPRACLVPTSLGRAIVKADCVRLRVHPQVADPRFAKYAVNSDQTRQRAKHLIHGVGRPRINLRDLRTLRLPVAPLPEQTRIVEAIESYFTRLDNAVATLERVQANLKRYRASVLKAAVEGRLVPTEAELARQEGRDYEPSSVLLERILEERRRRWEETELATLNAKGKAPKDDKWKAKYKEPLAPDTSELPELPEGWCWATWNQLSDWVTYGFTRPMPHVPDGVPIVTAKNVLDRRIDLQRTHKTTQEAFDDLSAKDRPKTGDILITKDGTMGRAAVVPDGSTFCINQSVAVAWVRTSKLEREYLLTVIESPETQRRVQKKARGVAIKHLSITDFAAMPLPLPPLAEQVRIAEETDRHVSIIESASRLTGSTLGRSTTLHQSVLKWAFEGKLADQDPNDEPASFLLERIKSAREPKAADTKPKTRKKRTTRKRSAA